MKGYDLFTAALPNPQPKLLKVGGTLQSVCPSADVICVWSPPRHMKPAMGGQPPERSPQRLVLYDLKADREKSELPIHPRNSHLDDWETQWTADGRYLYYYDVIVLKPGEALGRLPVRKRHSNTLDDGWTQWAAAGPPQGSYPVAFNAAGEEKGKTTSVTRVWDRVAGKQVGLCLDAVAVGPGPTPTSMFLAGRLSADRKGFWIHDARSGEKHMVGDLSTRLIHAWGSKVLYVRPKKVAPADQVARVEKLIAQLGSEKWQEREKAHKQLAGMSGAILPVLVKYLKSKDLEVRRRVEKIRGVVERRVEWRVFLGEVVERKLGGDNNRK